MQQVVGGIAFILAHGILHGHQRLQITSGPGILPTPPGRRPARENSGTPNNKMRSNGRIRVVLNGRFKAVGGVNPRVFLDELAGTVLSLHQILNVPRSVQHPHDFQRRGLSAIDD